MTPPGSPPGAAPTGWKCPKRTGFLFPHPCTRLTPEGCPDCQNGQLDDPYVRRPRYYYNDYDTYDDSLTFFALESLMHHHTGSEPMAADFTEADGESMVIPDDTYENDLSGS